MPRRGRARRSQRARATATEGSRSIPLGALAHLLPAGSRTSAETWCPSWPRSARCCSTRRQHGPLVLFVDDLQLLDSTSATLVGQLVDADLLFLVGTVRTARRSRPASRRCGIAARVRRVDLADLDRAAVDTLLHLVLGGPVEAATSTEIWSASQGNVAVRQGACAGRHRERSPRPQRGVWRLVGPFVTTPRLVSW